ncbi:hypothetical protein CEXT_330231 [Caerostris extrusa]|uniref:Uncharacterized protein n=1 Tax=Caerostris extrusa TaxID=172846 RepID=A0AAV4SIK6_CAEEX|nr:hypothetical protein CEXT_330231 [Caerostris extrusa]
MRYIILHLTSWWFQFDLGPPSVLMEFGSHHFKSGRHYVISHHSDLLCNKTIMSKHLQGEGGGDTVIECWGGGWKHEYVIPARAATFPLTCTDGLIGPSGGEGI